MSHNAEHTFIRHEPRDCDSDSRKIEAAHSSCLIAQLAAILTGARASVQWRDANAALPR